MCAVQEEEYTLATASQSADFAVQVLTLRKNFRQFQVRTPVGAAVGYPAYVDGCRHKTVPFAIASHQPETLRDAIPPHCATAAAQTRIFTLFVSAWADGRRRAARAAVTSARAASRSQETPSSKPSRCEAQLTLCAALQRGGCPSVCPSGQLSAKRPLGHTAGQLVFNSQVAAVLPAWTEWRWQDDHNQLPNWSAPHRLRRCQAPPHPPSLALPCLAFPSLPFPSLPDAG